MCRGNKGYWIAISGITFCVALTLSIYAYYFHFDHLQLDLLDIQYNNGSSPHADSEGPISEAAVINQSQDPSHISGNLKSQTTAAGQNFKASHPQDDITTDEKKVEVTPQEIATPVADQNIDKKNLIIEPSKGKNIQVNNNESESREPEDQSAEVNKNESKQPITGENAEVTKQEIQPVPKTEEVKTSEAEQDVTPPSKKASLLQHLLDDYKSNSGNISKQVEILTTLADLCARFENGRNLFTHTDGLETVLLPGLESEVVDIRRGVCNLVAVAVQNNAIAQAGAVRGGVLPYLIQLLKHDPVVRPRAFYALTTLLRNYPDAEKAFIVAGGIREVVLIGYLPETKVRCLHFLTDLMTERTLCRKEPQRKQLLPWEDAFATQSDDPCDRENLLTKALEEAEWDKLLCQSVRYLVNDTSEEIMVIAAVHASGEKYAKKLCHLRSNFEGLLSKYKREPEFRDTKQELMNILKWIDITLTSTGNTFQFPLTLLLICTYLTTQKLQFLR